MTAVAIRRLEPSADLTHVLGLLADFEASVADRLLADHGIVLADVAGDALVELRKILVPPGCFCVAEVDGLACGTIGVKSLGDCVGEIKRMYVDPAFRRLGVARALVERALAEAEAAGFHTLRLESAVWMVEAHALYRSVGFVDTDEYPEREMAHVQASQPLALFMERRVPAAETVPQI